MCPGLVCGLSRYQQQTHDQNPDHQLLALLLGAGARQGQVGRTGGWPGTHCLGSTCPPPHANTLSRGPDSRRASQALGATGCLAGSVGSTAQAANFPHQLPARACTSHHHPAGVKQRMFLCAALVGGGEGSLLSLRSLSSPTPGVPGCGSGPTWEREEDR